jgi:hypothetical protein
MKKVFKIAALLHVIILYCLVLSVYSHGIACTEISVSTGELSQKEHNISSVSANQTGFAVQTENSVIGYNNLPSSQNFHFNTFFGHHKSSDLFLLKTFPKYILYAKNIVVGFQQTDIIFPFHYFW